MTSSEKHCDVIGIGFGITLEDRCAAFLKFKPCVLCRCFKSHFKTVAGEIVLTKLPLQLEPHQLERLTHPTGLLPHRKRIANSLLEYIKKAKLQDLY